MAWGLRGRDRALLRERVTAVAPALLCIRVLEGLAAWLLFNHFYLATTTRPWSVLAAFVAYLLLNLLVGLRYRRGAIDGASVALDLGTNSLALSLPIAASGGLASPLLLLFPLKALHYAMVFGARRAALFLVLATFAVVPWVIVGVDGLQTIAASQRYLGPVLRALAIGIFVGAPLATAWLHRSLARVAARRAGERAERDAGSAVVANALLNVSEAVSRLTRIDRILAEVVEIAPRSLEVDYCGIALWAEDTGRYTGAVASGMDPTIDRRLADVELAPEEVPDFEWVRRLGHCAVVPAGESLQSSGLEMPAVLIAPLVSADKFFGVMELARRSARRAFTQRDLTIADGIARQTAVALERARLIEDSQRLMLAVESTEEAVLLTDAKRRITFANPAFLRTFGYRWEEIRRRDVLELVGPNREWLADMQEQIQRRSWRGEIVLPHHDGTDLPILANASLIRDDDGRALGAVAILADISAEKVFQEQMQRADRLAAVGEMAAGMAHEINNALAAIFGQTEKVEKRSDAELQEALRRVDGQARRIAEIVQGALGFARPRPPRSEAVDLARVATNTLDLVRHDLERQHVQLETRFDPDLPPAQADPQQVQQVLLNLFGNAIQAMNGRMDNWLRVEVMGVDDRLAVRVSDGGPGIPAALLPKIFDPFFSTKTEGSGLGLSVSYAIARAHGGDLRVSSEPGQGAVFTLLLPVSGAVAKRLEHVLLVDDDPDVADALSEMLVKEGLDVSRAASAAEAGQMLAQRDWDAVFLDVRLPDGSGPDIYAALRESRPETAQRVVFVTGGLWRSESRLWQELPPQPILAKPCTQDRVRDVLRQLRQQRRHAA